MALKKYDNLPNFFEIGHPIIKHKLSLLRDKNTHCKLFKELSAEIALLVGYEATKNLALRIGSIETPLEVFDAPVLDNRQFVIMPVLRAGLGMVDGLLNLLPMANVAHVGIYRDEKTLEAKEYYFNLPPNYKGALFFICDPMLATGGTACASIKRLKEQNIKNIIFLCLVAAPEGVRKTIAQHPDVKIYSAILDRELNDKGYILPGLGDAGDRLWGK